MARNLLRKEALESAWELACEGTQLVGSRLVVIDVPIEIYCDTCAARRPVESMQQMTCKVCGTPSSRIVAGKELELVAMEISDEQAAPTG